MKRSRPDASPYVESESEEEQQPEQEEPVPGPGPGPAALRPPRVQQVHQQQQQPQHSHTVTGFDVGRNLNVGEAIAILPNTINIPSLLQGSQGGASTSAEIKAFKVAGEMKAEKAFADMVGCSAYENYMARSNPGPGPGNVSAGSGSSTTRDNEKVYEVKRPGSVLILNNKFNAPKGSLSAGKYAGLEREGSDKDVQAMRTLFETELGCTVFLEENIKSNELQEKLEEFKNECKNRKSSFLVVIVMTHGGAQNLSLQMHDLREIDIYADLVYSFKEDRFPEFTGKPKIFFIQACATTLNIDGSSKPVPISKPVPEAVPDCLEADALRISRPRGEIADVFVGKSCLPHGLSWRQPDQGTWYIQSINWVFRNYWQSEDLEKMHNRVRDDVVEKGRTENLRRGPNQPQHRNQTPWNDLFDFGRFNFPSV